MNLDSPRLPQVAHSETVKHLRFADLLHGRRLNTLPLATDKLEHVLELDHPETHLLMISSVVVCCI
jgi:hypothetical protein